MKISSCICCKKERKIYARKMCGYCYSINMQNKARIKAQDKRKSISKGEVLKKVMLRNKPLNSKTLSRIASDKKFYNEVYEGSNKSCQECGVYLGEKVKPIFISHILSKGSNQGMRYDKRNINILCPAHHYQWEFGNRTEMVIWSENQTTIENLKVEYYYKD